LLIGLKDNLRRTSSEHCVSKENARHVDAQIFGITGDMKFPKPMNLSEASPHTACMLFSINGFYYELGRLTQIEERLNII
jgi:hypothetical protein